MNRGRAGGAGVRAEGRVREKEVLPHVMRQLPQGGWKVSVFTADIQALLIRVPSE